jgi:hypothetical protein
MLESIIISVRYSYQNEILLQSETWQIPRDIAEDISSTNEDEALLPETETDESPETVNEKIHLWSDMYRYARTGSLRLVERKFYANETENDIRLTRFAPLTLHDENTSASHSIPVISSDFLSDITTITNINIEYIADDKGNIVSEIHKDEEGTIIGELINTWSGDRLASIAWNGENDVRLIEYEYDEDGNRIIERNYQDGILERLIRIEEDREVEELYLQGRLSLRAVWKDGQKISEEYYQQNMRRNP